MMVSMITVQPYAADYESPMSHQQMPMVRVVMLPSTVQQLASLSASEVGMPVVTAVAILQQQQGSEAPGCGWQS